MSEGSLCCQGASSPVEPPLGLDYQRVVLDPASCGSTRSAHRALMSGGATSTCHAARAAPIEVRLNCPLPNRPYACQARMSYGFIRGRVDVGRHPLNGALRRQPRAAISIAPGARQSLRLELLIADPNEVIRLAPIVIFGIETQHLGPFHEHQPVDHDRRVACARRRE